MGINWDFIYNYRDKTPPWGPVGYVTYKRTYARMTDDGITEEWWQTLFRAIRSLIDDLDGDFSQEEVEALMYYCFNLKMGFSGRALWQLGTETIRKIGADSLQNCWHVAIAEAIKPFTFTFNQLMLGGGVGFNITPEQVYEIPSVRYRPQIQRVDKNDVGYIVPDNREGWVELLERVLHSHFYTGHDLTYSTLAIRGKGAKISNFGGIASGPEELSWGVQQISKIIQRRYGEKLRPIDTLDILNIIGFVVVSGNVRRSAELALGDSHDVAFLNSKAFGRATIPNWRSMSNNSCNCFDIRDLPNLFWQNFTEENPHGDLVSECFGLVNLHNCRRFGRLADGHDYRPDPFVTGTNPCGEIPAESYEACNLAEIYLPNVEDEAEFRQVTKLAYKVCKTISCFPFQDRRVNEVVSRNHRIGIGVTGFLQAPHLRDEQIFNNVYRALEYTDKKFSKHLGVEPSIKLTCVKPSGTSSLLAGVTPGVHPAFAPYYLRRIRFAANDPLVDTCRDAGFSVESVVQIDGSLDHGTQVVSFPVATPEGTTCAQNITAIDQLEFQKWLQTNWADNSVSVTIYFQKDELPGIRNWLQRVYPESIKAVSFARHSAHGFVQAPYEAITPGQYQDLISKSIPITTIVDRQQTDMAESVECEGGTCPPR